MYIPHPPSSSDSLCFHSPFCRCCPRFPPVFFRLSSSSLPFFVTVYTPTFVSVPSVSFSSSLDLPFSRMCNNFRFSTVAVSLLPLCLFLSRFSLLSISAASCNSRSNTLPPTRRSSRHPLRSFSTQTRTVPLAPGRRRADNDQRPLSSLAEGAR
jgi:hypothetical protein